METGMEEFLNEILGNGGEQILAFASTLICISSNDFVFTKYDMPTTAIEFGFLENGKNYNSEDVELKAKRDPEKRCIQPIQRLTKEKNIQHIVVTGEHVVLLSIAQINHWF